MDDVGRIAVRRARLTLIFGIAVVAALGAALGVAVEELDARTSANARALFRLPPEGSR